MAIKKFSKYIQEGTGTSAASNFVAPKDDDQEVKGYKPRSKGEEDFANAHTVTKHDYPVDVEAQFTGGNTQKPRQPNNGEKTTTQGSSTVNQPKGGGDSKRTADRKQGDMKPVNPIKESLKRIPMVEVEMECPPATKDLKLNTKNRDASIKAEHIKYGPLNVDSPGDYWEKIAEYWDTTLEAAKKSKCSNCVAFDISPRMKECMPGETSDEDGILGYCWMHHFKCHSARSCRTWAKGGPIKDDKKSYDWQQRAFGKKGSAELEEKVSPKEFSKLKGVYKDKVSGAVIEFDSVGFVVEPKSGSNITFEWKNMNPLDESVELDEAKSKEQQIADLEKMLGRISGNTSSVKMKKVALQRKIDKLKSEELDELKAYDKNADFRLLNRLSQKQKSGNLTPAEKQQMANAKARLRNHGITEDVELFEGKVMDALEDIVKKKQAKSVKFANGKSVKIDMTSANAMLNLRKKLTDQNKKKMEDQIEKSPENFMRLMDLAFSSFGAKDAE